MSKQKIYPWYTVSQASNYLCCSTRTIHRLISKNKLRTHRPNGQRKLLVHRKYLDAYLLGFGNAITPSQRKVIEQLHKGYDEGDAPVRVV